VPDGWRGDGQRERRRRREGRLLARADVVRERPELKAAIAAAREYRSLGAKVTHEMKRVGRGAP
jgi:hypothetical protein